MPHMIGLLPLYPAHGSALKGSTPTDLHERINPHFILARHRSCGFGSGPSDYTHFNMSRLTEVARLLLSLWVPFYLKLPSPLRQTPCHIIRNTRYNPGTSSFATTALQQLRSRTSLLSRSTL